MSGLIYNYFSMKSLRKDSNSKQRAANGTQNSKFDDNTLSQLINDGDIIADTQPRSGLGYAITKPANSHRNSFVDNQEAAHQKSIANTWANVGKAGLAISMATSQYQVSFKVQHKVQFGHKLVVLGSIPELDKWKK